MIYYISDLHFGYEKVLKIDKLPVDTVEERNNLIIEKWNRKVTENDDVYIVGDVIWNETCQEEAIPILNKLKGNKYLALGNHDKITLPEFRNCFVAINEYFDIYDQDRQVFLSHYPTMFYPHQHKGGFMLYGHIHKSPEYGFVLKWREELLSKDIPANLFNVGCMVNYMDFTPRSLDELICFNQ